MITSQVEDVRNVKNTTTQQIVVDTANLTQDTTGAAPLDRRSVKIGEQEVNVIVVPQDSQDRTVICVQLGTTLKECVMYSVSPTQRDTPARTKVINSAWYIELDMTASSVRITTLERIA